MIEPTTKELKQLMPYCIIILIVYGFLVVMMPFTDMAKTDNEPIDYRYNPAVNYESIY